MKQLIRKKQQVYVKKVTVVVITFVIIQLITLSTALLQAQLKGSHLLGQVGLQSGTQGPPGLNLVVIPIYLYSADKLKNNEGNTEGKDLSLNSYVAASGLSWILNKKFLNANIGGTVLLPFVTNKIDANLGNESTSFAYSDTYIQPIQLGWHGKRADFTTGFALYIPTGKYDFGGDNNSGLGMWGYEFSAGSTLYFDDKKTWSLSALLSYELNSKKKDTDIKAGDLLSVEGGLGKTWYVKTKGPVPVVINAGIAYYMQYKTSKDEVSVNNIVLGNNLDKDRIYGVGVEGNVLIPSMKSMFSVRFIPEMGAVNRLQGNTFLVTWAYNIKSFAPPSG